MASSLVIFLLVHLSRSLALGPLQFFWPFRLPELILPEPLLFLSFFFFTIFLALVNVSVLRKMRLSSLLLLLLLVSLRVPQRLDDRGRGRLCINLERDVGGDDLAGAFGVAFPFRFRRLGGLLSSSEDDREASRNGWWLCLRGCRLLLFRRDNSVLFLSTNSSFHRSKKSCSSRTTSSRRPSFWVLAVFLQNWAKQSWFLIALRDA